MTEKEFLRPRFCGARFEKGDIPLDALADLVALNDMVIEVAKWEFRKAHPDHKRIPKDLFRDIELRLSGVEKGSAVAAINIHHAHTLVPFEGVECIERAGERIVNAIAMAEQSKSPTSYLEEEHLTHLKHIGKSLHPDESIEFTTHESNSMAHLTSETRRFLERITKKVQETTGKETVRAAISEMDHDKKTFELQLADGRKITSPTPDQHFGVILDAFDRYHQNVRVRVKGVSRQNKQGRLIGMESVEHINLLDPLDISAQLDDFRNMKNGWLEGGGIAPSHDGLEWLAEAFEDHYPNDIPRPCIYPTGEGGVRAEWSQGNSNVILEIDLNTHRGEWLWFDENSTDENEKKLNLDKDNDWKWLSAEIINKITKTQTEHG